MIGVPALAIATHRTVQELAATVLPHPTFGEGIGEAAQELCRRME